MTTNPIKLRFISADDDLPAEARAKVAEIFDDVKDVIDKIAKQVTPQHVRMTQMYHAIGKVLLQKSERLAEAAKKCDCYQVDFFTELGEIVGLHPRTLYDCRKFAELYDKSQVVELVNLGIRWSHIRHLLSLNTENERTKFAKLAASKNLTAEELAEVIRTRKLPTRKPNTGKKAKPPANLNKAFGKLDAWLRQSRSRVLDNLFGDDYDLPAEIKAEPPDNLTPDQKQQIASAADQLEAVGHKALEEAQRLRDTLPRFDQIFIEREKDNQAKLAEAAKSPGQIVRRRRAVTTEPVQA